MYKDKKIKVSKEDIATIKNIEAFWQRLLWSNLNNNVKKLFIDFMLSNPAITKKVISEYLKSGK